MKKFLVLALFWPACLLAQPSVCEPTPRFMATIPKMTGDRLGPFLKQAQFAALEDELGFKLRRTGSGLYMDDQLLYDIKAIAQPDPALEPLLAQWVREYPKSTVARLVKAEYHSGMGYARRGAGFADKTSREQFAAMEEEFDKAFAELRVAMELEPHSALPHALLLGMVRSVGGNEQLQAVEAAAEKADPHTLAARRVALFAMVPKWGGSFEQQTELLRRAVDAGLPPAQVRYLAHTAQMARADHFDVVTREKTRAIAEYRLAGELCPDSSAWARIIDAANVLEDWQTAREAADRHLAVRPADGLVLQQRGWAFEKTGDLAAAARDYEAAARLGQPWAQQRFGFFLMTGKGLPQDRERARMVLEAAAANGNAAARAHLDQLNRETAAH